MHAEERKEGRKEGRKVCGNKLLMEQWKRERERERATTRTVTRLRTWTRTRKRGRETLAHYNVRELWWSGAHYQSNFLFWVIMWCCMTSTLKKSRAKNIGIKNDDAVANAISGTIHIWGPHWEGGGTQGGTKEDDVESEVAWILFCRSVPNEDKGEGVQKCKNFADVIYGWPLWVRHSRRGVSPMQCPSLCTAMQGCGRRCTKRLFFGGGGSNGRLKRCATTWQPRANFILSKSHPYTQFILWET